MSRLKKERKSTRKIKRFNWEDAPDIRARTLKLVTDLKMDTVLFERIFFFRSFGSKSRAYARTWGLPALWQHALDVEPAYIIEVLSHYFDKLSQKEKDRVLLHELSHIPKNFSGALIPHTRRRKGSFHSKLEELIDKYFETMK
ncbi:MAG TPA: putative metallopeptidase [Patescibacteria group bacterium]|nr:putative metallopeptidase [Patescibacteria group bacterium]